MEPARMMPAGMKEQAALFLQIKEWMELQGRLDDLTRQLETAITEKATAEVEAEAARQAERQARAELVVERERLTALQTERATPPATDAGLPAMLEASKAEVERLTSLLQRKAVDDATVRQALEAARLAGEHPQTPPAPGPADFEILIRRGSDGLLEKLIVKEKG